MDITFACSKCGQHIVIDVAGAGQLVDCPQCGNALEVPFPKQLKPASAEKPRTVVFNKQPPQPLATIGTQHNYSHRPPGSGRLPQNHTVVRNVILLVGCLGVIGIISVSAWLYSRGFLNRVKVSPGGLLQAAREIVEDRYVADRSYETEIAAVLSDKSANDAAMNSAIQQCANGAYRAADMLSIIAHQVDKDGSSAESISSIISKMHSSNLSARGAAQQAANGTYKCVELLGIIAAEMDRKNTHAEEFRSVLSRMSIEDVSTESAYQQVANGGYRMAELLAVICRIVDSKNAYSSSIESALSDMRINEIGTRSALQQSANGLDASAKLMAIFAQLVDHDGKNARIIESSLSQMRINDVSADTAYQQMANRLYRITDLAALVARGLNP